MDNFIQEVREQELIKEFDARLWGSLVDFITVYSKDDIRVTFKDGTENRAYAGKKDYGRESKRKRRILCRIFDEENRNMI